jgi:hypothetical protein
MPLFSPSLHAIASAPVVSAPDGLADTLVFWDATTQRAARVNLADHAQAECFVFGMNGLASDSPTTSSNQNFVLSSTLPKFDLRWPFDFRCTGIVQTVSARSSRTGRPAAGINVFRNNNSVFNNTTTVSTPFCTIACGTPVLSGLTSAEVLPNAAHETWTKGDRIRLYLVAGERGRNTQTENFHASKVYIKGYRL